MSIHIREDVCVGCGECAAVCPGTLLAMQNGKAVMQYPKDCWGCTACLKECACGAIRLFLGADVGGRGTELFVRREGTLLHWQFVSPGGGTNTITVDAADANRY